MTETTFETVQAGRHAVRDLLSRAFKSYGEAGEEFEAERGAVGGATGLARELLRGRVGLSQDEQVARLERAGRAIDVAIRVSTLTEAAEALAEAKAALEEASETNGAVKDLAATRDFDAHQADKAAKKAEAAAAYESEPFEDDDFEDDDEDDYDEDDEA